MVLDLQRNLLSAALIGAGGLLATLILVQAVFLGRPDVDSIAPAELQQSQLSEVDTPDTGLSELQYYSVITEYPLFFADRRLPVIDLDPEDDFEEEEIIEPDEPIEGLRARIAGIIITPTSRLAMVHDEVAGKTVHLQEGMSLEGEQADWRLERIETRMAHFVATDGKEAGLELEVYTSALGGGSSAAPRTPRSREQQRGEEETADQPANGEDGQDEARARAEAVRQRVAERRAELREEARRRQEEAGQQRRRGREEQ